MLELPEHGIEAALLQLFLLDVAIVTRVTTPMDNISLMDWLVKLIRKRGKTA